MPKFCVIVKFILSGKICYHIEDQSLQYYIGGKGR